MSDAQFDPMLPPRYHPERGGLPAPLWANTPEMGQSTRIAPMTDATNARGMESTILGFPF